MPNLKPVKIIIAGVDKFSKKFDKQFKTIKKMGDRMSSAGKKMTMGLTVPILGVGVAIAKTAADFEYNMNRVEALTQGTTAQMKSMSDMAKQLGSTTRFSASEAADAMGFLGMAGFKVNEILAATPSLLDLAASSQIDLARAADIASNIMGAFNIDASEMSKIADVLAATTASSNVNMEMLAETMKFAGPIAHEFGTSLGDVSAAAGFLGNIGIQGSLAGTALRTAFTRLASPVKEGAIALRNIGIDVETSSGKLRDFKAILIDLSRKLPELTEAKQIQALNAIFGKTAISATAGIIDNISTGKRGFLQLADALQNVTGWSKRMADTMNKGAFGAFKKLQASLEAVAIAFGESGLLDIITKALIKFAKFFGNMSKQNPTLLKTIMIIAGLIAVLGPLLVVIGSVTSAIAATSIALTALGGIAAVIASPLVIIAAKVAIAIAAFTAFIAIAKNLDKTWGKIGALMVAYINPFLIIPMWIVSRWSKLVPYFRAFGKILGKIFGDMKTGAFGKTIMWIFEIVGKLTDAVMKLMDVIVFDTLGKIAAFFLTPGELQSVGLTADGRNIINDKGDTKDQMRSGLLNPGKHDSVTRVIFDNLPGNAQILKEQGNTDIEVQNGPLITGYVF